MAKAPAKAAGGAGAPDELAQTQRALNDATLLTQLVATNFDSRYAATAETLQKLLDDNAELRRSNAELKRKEEETYRYMQKQLDAKTTEFAQAQERIKKLEERLVRVPLDIKAAAEAAKAVMRNELEDLTRKLRERDSALERLADFRKEREDVLAELDRTREELEAERQAHQKDMEILELRNIRDRDHVKSLMFEKIREAKVKIMAQAAGNLDATTRRIIAENDQLVSELTFQSKQAERLAHMNSSVLQDNTELRRQLALGEQENAALFTRIHALVAALKAARDHLEGKDGAAAGNTLRIGPGSPRAGTVGRSALDTASAATSQRVSTSTGMSRTAAARYQIHVEQVRLPPSSPMRATTAPLRAGRPDSSDGGDGETPVAQAPAPEPRSTSADTGADATSAALDSALGLLAVLDAQRVEYVSLADNTVLALMRAAKELRADIQRIAGHGAGAALQDAEARGKGAAYQPVTADVVDPAIQSSRLLSVSGHQMAAELPGLAGSAGEGHSGVSSLLQSAAEKVEVSSLEVYKVVNQLLTRMRYHLADMTRAVPYPITLDQVHQLADAAAEDGQQPQHARGLAALSSALRDRSSAPLPPTSYNAFIHAPSTEPSVHAPSHDPVSVRALRVLAETAPTSVPDAPAVSGQVEGGDEAQHQYSAAPAAQQQAASIADERRREVRTASSSMRGGESILPSLTGTGSGLGGPVGLGRPRLFGLKSSSLRPLLPANSSSRYQVMPDEIKPAVRSWMVK